MTQYFFLFIILMHFLADFALQTHEQAIGKSQGASFFNKHLFQHVGVYSLVWLLASATVFQDWRCFLFAYTTFCLHYVTDWVTSRLSKKFFTANDYHNGFVVVGFDQMLHYIQLYITFKLLL